MAFGQDPLITRVIAAARDFDQHLPNFICRQVTRRYHGKSLADTYEEELTYFERREKRRLLAVNGKPVTANKTVKGGFRSNGLFGRMLSRIFGPESKAEFTRAGEAVEAGRKVDVLRFSVRKENSTWQADSGGKSYSRGFSGTVWADAETHMVLRVEAHPDPEPGDPAWLVTMSDEVRYGPAKVAGVDQLLPIQAVSTLGSWNRKNISDFSDFRQYATETKIEFGDPK